MDFSVRYLKQNMPRWLAIRGVQLAVASVASGLYCDPFGVQVVNQGMHCYGRSKLSKLRDSDLPLLKR